LELPPRVEGQHQNIRGVGGGHHPCSYSYQAPPALQRREASKQALPTLQLPGPPKLQSCAQGDVSEPRLNRAARVLYSTSPSGSLGHSKQFFKSGSWPAWYCLFPSELSSTLQNQYRSFRLSYSQSRQHRGGGTMPSRNFFMTASRPFPWLLTCRTRLIFSRLHSRQSPWGWVDLGLRKFPPRSD